MILKEILKKNNKSYTEEREFIFSIIRELHHFDYSKLQGKLEEKNIKI
jgi:predicted hydrolase (HD superfamily)